MVLRFLSLAQERVCGFGSGEARRAAGVLVVLVRRDAETGDIAALEAAEGLLTQNGARTSHAAVVARQLGKVCLVGCAELSIDEAGRTISLGGLQLAEGGLITLDGNSGFVYAGRMQVMSDKQVGLIERLEALRAGKESLSQESERSCCGRNPL